MKVNHLPIISLIALIFSCTNDNTDPIQNNEVPTSYTFERDGQSTVSYQGQTDRLNMLSEIKSYLQTGDAGAELSSQKLLDMYANANSSFESADLNASTKQLENKTNPAQIEFFKSILNDASIVSAEVANNSTQAAEGIAGSIERGTSGKFINVNEKGWEFTQFVEKGLMGAVFYHQIFNVYLSEGKIGEAVDNVNLEEGKNYTAMEHHWDEAFGYWGVPVDFPNGDPVLDDDHKRFWASYTNSVDEFFGVNEKLMTAYITGRAAIVANNHSVKNAQIEIIIDQHELVTAAKTVHYINASMNSLSAGDLGNLFHSLSEAYNFAKAITYSPNKKLSQPELEEILNVDFGEDGDFWSVTMAGLQNAKDKLTSAYPELKAVEDEL
ncbi:DUF4856 domain-containing protein [Echinicola salinicaeni]|uniref:DUF4856 domain-containing protein n=1 Tax=Echinicola salinicaeni TaxID=2762757 RepID=UPI0016455963|nr:DUF4856 domain-containing protein [Echinicola salinicaeni]